MGSRVRGLPSWLGEPGKGVEVLERRGEGCSLAPEQRESGPGAAGAQNERGSGGWKEPLKWTGLPCPFQIHVHLGPQSVARLGNRVFAQPG